MAEKIADDKKMEEQELEAQFRADCTRSIGLLALSALFAWYIS